MNSSNKTDTDTANKIPVVILNGFLGSGKTTLFRNLLAQARKKDISVCEVVNDMSELDVDGELIAGTDIVEDDNSIFQSIHSCVLSSKKLAEELSRAQSLYLKVFRSTDSIHVKISDRGQLKIHFRTYSSFD